LSSPWDTKWLPDEREIVSFRINDILAGTGLSGFGNTILQSASDYQVNPAFALAMFRKEANFAAPGTRANKNNNPGNIIATGECRGKPVRTSCNGVYGETSTDGRFGVYPDTDAGIKAYFQLLNQEYAPGSKRNCSDISCIIQAYCPSSDCDTQNYINQVARWEKDYQCQLYTGSTIPSLTQTVKPTIVITPISTPTEIQTPISLDPNDFLSVAQWVVNSISNNKPEMIADLIGDDGAKFETFAHGAFPVGYNNSEDIVNELRKGLVDSSPECLGYNDKDFSSLLVDRQS